MRSYLLKEIPDHLAALAVEGYHKPGSLTQASGAWIHSAGSFVLEKGTWPLNAHDQWVWLAVEKGNIVLFWDNHELALSAGSTCFCPPVPPVSCPAATSAVKSLRKRIPAACGSHWRGR